MNKVKVLIVSDMLEYGGSDIVATRLQQNLDSDKFECVYCVRHDAKGPYEYELEKTGVRIIHQPDNQLGLLKSIKFFDTLFKKEKYDVVHSHLLFYSGIILKAAKRNGVRIRIAHSHFSQPLNKYSNIIKRIVVNCYHFYMRRMINKYATTVIGCSYPTGEYLAGKNTFLKKGVVLNNGIDTKGYEYNESQRHEKRLELGIDENEVVIGHIGHFYHIKNQSFLLDIFSQFKKQKDNAVLLLVGDGEDREKLEKKANDLNISDNVKFVGIRTDVCQLLSAMDCFVFPSIHEGFPLTLVEAQAAKLPCVVSNSITRDTNLSDAIWYCSIYSSPQEWVNQIDYAIKINREKINNSKVIEDFDIKSVCKKLEEIYLS